VKLEIPTSIDPVGRVTVSTAAGKLYSEEHQMPFPSPHEIKVPAGVSEDEIEVVFVGIGNNNKPSGEPVIVKKASNHAEKAAAEKAAAEKAAAEKAAAEKAKMEAEEAAAKEAAEKAVVHYEVPDTTVSVESPPQFAADITDEMKAIVEENKAIVEENKAADEPVKTSAPTQDPSHPRTRSH